MPVLPTTNSGSPGDAVYLDASGALPGLYAPYLTGLQGFASGAAVSMARTVIDDFSAGGSPLIAEENISGFVAVAISQSGNLRVAMPAVSGRMPAVGVATSGALSGQPCSFWTEGFFQIPSNSGSYDFSGTLGQPVYAARSGQVGIWSGGFLSGGFSSGDVPQRIGVVVNSGAIRIALDPFTKDSVQSPPGPAWLLSGDVASGQIGFGHLANASVQSGTIASGQISHFHLASGAITPPDIGSGAVQSGDVGDAALVSGSIASGQIGWPHIASGAIRSGDIGDAAVLSGSVASGQIASGHMASGFIFYLTNSATLTSGQVTSGFLGDASVVSGSIASGQIGHFHIASGAIGSGQLGSGAVQGAAGATRNVASGTLAHNDFGSGAIQSGDIASGQIGFGHLANASVQSGTLASGQVSQFHLASGAVNSGQVGSGSIVGAVGAGRSIASGTLAHPDFGSGAVQSGDIASGQIGFGHLANASIQSGTLASGQVSQFHLSSGAVNSGQVASGAVIGAAGGGARTIASGTVSTFDIASGAIRSGQIGDGAVVSGSIASGVITSIALASGDVITAARYVIDDFSAGGSPLLTEENISGFVAVAISQSGNLRVAMPSVSGRMPVVGVAVSGALSGQTASFWTDGFFQIPANSGSYNFSGFIGQPVYAARSGQIGPISGGFLSGGFASGDIPQLIGVIINSGGVRLSVEPTFKGGPQSTPGTFWISSGDLASGTVSRSVLASGAVNSGHVASGAVLGSLGGGAFTIASGTIGPNDIGSGAILSGAIASGQVGFNHLASGSVGSGAIASGQVTNLKLGSGSVTSGTIASGQVGFGHLANASVQSGTLASGQVSQFALASGAVNSGQVGSGAIIGAVGGGARNVASGTLAHPDFGSGAILSGDVASGQIGFGHLANASVQSGTIASGVVSQFHHASGAVNSGHVASGAVLGSLGGGAFTIASGTIGPNDLGSGSVLSGAIASGQVGFNHLSSGSVGSGALASGQVTNFKLASGAVNSGHIGSGAVLGAVGGGARTIASGTIAHPDFGSGAIQSGDIASGQIGQFHLASGIITTIPTGRTLWVDSINGNNATSQRGFENLPFLTISGAVTAASSGDLIHLRPGTYPEAVTLKAGVTMRGQDPKLCIIAGTGASGEVVVYASGSLTGIAVTDLTITSTPASGAITKAVSLIGTLTSASGSVTIPQFIRCAINGDTTNVGSTVTGFEDFTGGGGPPSTTPPLLKDCIVALINATSGSIGVSKPGASSTNYEDLRVNLDSNANIFAVGMSVTAATTGLWLIRNRLESDNTAAALSVNNNPTIFVDEATSYTSFSAPGGNTSLARDANSNGATTQLNYPRNNFNATTNPAASDDQTKGYAYLSQWLNTVFGWLWICVNPGAGGAVWVRSTLINGSVQSGTIGSGAIQSGNFASGVVSRFILASGAVNSGHVASGAVLGSLGGGAFTIASGTIGPNDIGSGAVLSGAIASGQVGQFHISSGAVTSGRIGAGGTPNGTQFLRDDFTWASPGAASVNSGDIGSGKIASGAVQGFFGSTRQIASGTVGVFDLGSGAVTAGTVGSGAVVSGNIASGQIGTRHLASGDVIGMARAVIDDFSAAGAPLVTEETVSGFVAVAISQSGNLRVAMPGVSGRMPAVGIAVSGALSGQTASFWTDGFFQATSGLLNFSGVIGAAVYVARSGQLGVASGGYLSGGFTSGDIQQVAGVVVNSGTMRIRLDQSVKTAPWSVPSSFWITSGDIASGSIGQFHLASGSVTSGAIASGQVSHFALASGAVGSGQLASGVIGSMPTGNQVWVDAVNGSDATGTRGQQDKPFLTISAAITAASAGDTVRVRPGTYNETITCKDDVSVIGEDLIKCVISRTASATETVVTMAERMVFGFFTLNLAPSAGTTTGVLFPGGGSSSNSTSTLYRVNVYGNPTGSGVVNAAQCSSIFSLGGLTSQNRTGVGCKLQGNGTGGVGLLQDGTGESSWDDCFITAIISTNSTSVTAGNVYLWRTKNGGTASATSGTIFPDASCIFNAISAVGGNGGVSLDTVNPSFPFNKSTTTDPTATDDKTKGYVAGRSEWLNTTTKRVWKLADATSGAAVWFREVGAMVSGSPTSGDVVTAANHIIDDFSAAGTPLVTEENISGFVAVAISQSGNLRVAMPAVSGRMPAVGIAVSGALSGQFASFWTDGTFQIAVNSGSYNFSGVIGQPVYIARSGQVGVASGGFLSGGFSSGDIHQMVGIIINSGAMRLCLNPEPNRAGLWGTPSTFWITSGDVSSGQIGQFHLASGAVNSGQVASGAVVGSLGGGAFTIASGTIGPNDIGSGAIRSGAIASGQVSQFALASGAVNSGHVGSGSVVGAIGAGRSIASGTVAHPDFGSGAIQSGDIASGQIGFGHLANASVQSGTLASGVVSRFNLASGAVNSGQVASGAVVGSLGGGAFTIASGTVGPNDLGSGSVLSGAIASGQVGAFHLSSGSIVSGRIASGQVHQFALGSGCVQSGQINSGNVITYARNSYEDTMVANEAISGIVAIAMDSGGVNIVRAQPGSGLRMPAIGVSVTNVVSGGVVTFIRQGKLLVSASGTIGGSGFLGGMQATAYVGSGGLLISQSGFVTGASSGGGPGVAGTSGRAVQRIGVFISGGIVVNIDLNLTSGLLTLPIAGSPLF